MDDRDLRRDADVVRQLDQLVAGRISRREALRRLGILGLSLPIASSLVAACAGGTNAPKPSTKSKLVVGIVQEPTSLDPTLDATNSISVTLRDNLYEGLVRLDQGGKIVPQLAKTWDVSADGKTLTFHLVSSAKWHDGSPFTAQDVKFAWDRARSISTKPPNPHTAYWAPVQAIDAVDDHTVKVTLSSYSDNWLFHMAAGSACIVSSKNTDSNRTNPIGTGPFKFVAWNRGASLQLTRNDDYWGSKAKLKDVEFRFITDPNAMNNALKAGDIDAVGQVNGPEQVASFQQDQSYTVLKAQPTGKFMLALNNSKPPFNDKRVRQALYAVIDRKAWIDGIASGFGAPIGSHAVPNDGEPYYVDETAVNPHDPAKAKQLLQAAGQTNLTVRYAQVTDFPYAVRATDILASALKDVGVTLKVEPMPFAAWLANVFGGAQDYDLTMINHAEERDIGNYANPKYYWHYSNSQVTQWLAQADAETDANKRKSLYAQVQRQLADDAAHAWVYSANSLAVLKHNLQGFQLYGISPSMYLGDAYFS
jgi:peptide/nickel transport system substrate-binding protein